MGLRSEYRSATAVGRKTLIHIIIQSKLIINVMVVATLKTSGWIAVLTISIPLPGNLFDSDHHCYDSVCNSSTTLIVIPISDVDLQ